MTEGKKKPLDLGKTAGYFFQHLRQSEASKLPGFIFEEALFETWGLLMEHGKEGIHSGQHLRYLRTGEGS